MKMKETRKGTGEDMIKAHCMGWGDGSTRAHSTLAEDPAPKQLANKHCNPRSK